MRRVHDESLANGVYEYIHLFQRKHPEQRLHIFSGENDRVQIRGPVLESDLDGKDMIALDPIAIGEYGTLLAYNRYLQKFLDVFVDDHMKSA